jgi:hypothetical protein
MNNILSALALTIVLLFSLIGDFLAQSPRGIALVDVTPVSVTFQFDVNLYTVGTFCSGSISGVKIVSSPGATIKVVSSNVNKYLADFHVRLSGYDIGVPYWTGYYSTCQTATVPASSLTSFTQLCIYNACGSCGGTETNRFQGQFYLEGVTLNQSLRTWGDPVVPQCTMPFPTFTPTFVPTMPSSQPTSLPSRQPYGCPTAQPTRLPSQQPSSLPSAQPTTLPTAQPSSRPSAQPSSRPTGQPTSLPSTQPTALPTIQPTSFPTVQPTNGPSNQPSVFPSSQPNASPTAQPSVRPSNQPTGVPTHQPLSFPTSVPSNQPSRRPSGQPSLTPSNQPTVIPSMQPIFSPTKQPSSFPTVHPSSQPSRSPSCQPISFPTSRPSSQPTMIPTVQPFAFPTSAPVVTIYQTNGVLFWLGSTSGSANLTRNDEGYGALGTSYILFGRNFKHQSRFPFAISLNSISSREFVSEINENDRTTGVYHDQTLRSTTIVGDVNGDGFPDLLVGYPLISKCSVYLGTEWMILSLLFPPRENPLRL